MKHEHRWEWMAATIEIGRPLMPPPSTFKGRVRLKSIAGAPMKRPSSAAALLLIVAAGCLPLAQPAYHESDLVFDPAVIGLWQQDDGPARWDFSHAGEKDYLLVYTDTEGRSGRFLARIGEFGGIRVLDLFPVKEDIEANEFYRFHLMPIHTAYLMRKTDAGMELAGFDLNWLTEYLTSHPEALEHTSFNGQLLVTASTDEVQAFILEHQAQFSGVFQLTPVRKSET